MESEKTLRLRALMMLVWATLLWGLSFPLIKALGVTHASVDPQAEGYFLTVYTIAPRFVLAVLVLSLWQGRRLLGTTKAELGQGLRLGAFVAGGMLLQNEGLRHTAASTSAFLTQLYAVLIPLWWALKHRRSPGAWIWVAVVLVLLGVGVLGRFDWSHFRLGWGETVTLLSSLFYMGQILALDNPRTAGQDPLRVTFVLFLTEAVVFGVLSFVLAPQMASLALPWQNLPWVGMTGLLTAFCTLGAFFLMNKWQPVISSTEAGLVYCVEPVFGSLMALFVPAWLSVWAGIDYANESASLTLVVGGVLITGANVIVQLKPPART